MSGNYRGKPKQIELVLDRGEIFRRVAYEMIDVQCEGGRERMPQCQALLYLLWKLAIGGDQDAARLLEDFRKLYPASAADPVDIVFTLSEADERL